MDITTLVVSILPYLTGPAAAVIVMALVLIAIWVTFDKKIVPILSAAISKHLEQFDDLLESHKADRDETIKAFQEITLQQVKHEMKIDNLTKDVSEIRFDINDLKKYNIERNGAYSLSESSKDITQAV